MCMLSSKFSNVRFFKRELIAIACCKTFYCLQHALNSMLLHKGVKVCRFASLLKCNYVSCMNTARAIIYAEYCKCVLENGEKKQYVRGVRDAKKE